MEVAVENLQRKVPLNHLQIIKIAKTILRHEGAKKAVVCVVFVTGRKIRSLNKKYLNKDYGTDVLAFDWKEEGGGPRPVSAGRKKEKEVFGDIVISTDTALGNCREFGTLPEEEIVLYLVHGILHLLGYDDHVRDDIKRMRDKEQILMRHLKPKIKTVLK